MLQMVNNLKIEARPTRPAQPDPDQDANQQPRSDEPLIPPLTQKSIFCSNILVMFASLLISP